ncbi:sulfotransferase family 2 domain-containing protein [uncultured Shimia sp.]|uniref:sulfotransferase family 2 domain-containing protein n=1 Tax=uncultured Shimia sp. TaxID=573152 RepID=UPI00261801C8|nr:sulfotransferase family 2 domain-containing protein [uncultured Shimia sp.]
MLVFFKQNLTFFSVPKTGTTAYSMAMKPHADIIFGRRVKHMTVGKYHSKFAPFLRRTFDLTPERFAVMRDPVDQLRSWYKYRSRRKITDSATSTRGVSFDEFVLDAISDTPTVSKAIGSQYRFLSIRDGSVPVHHLFAYEQQDLLKGFLADRFEEDLTFKDKNVSPDIPAPISPEVEAKLRAARQQEFDLYARIRDAGGVLRDYPTP